jgi:two-component system, chemotaxis family, chemotaxis protein CheY
MSKTIITVDDASTMRRLVSFTLKGAGHNVLEAADGVEALKVVKENRVDLVLTDLNMPNMDGIELTRQLRAQDSYKSTPILLLTTESEVSKKQAGKAAGATGWIVKPFTPEQLLALINRVMPA